MHDFEAIMTAFRSDVCGTDANQSSSSPGLAASCDPERVDLPDGLMGTDDADGGGDFSIERAGGMDTTK